MPDAPRQLRTDLPGAGPFRAVLWHQDALDETEFAPDEWLAPEERAELATLASEKRRREWLAARTALKDLLVRDGVVRRPSDAIVRKDGRGAPHLVVWEPDTMRYAELACAISHSAPFVLCAYLRGRGARIGVDVERRSWRRSRLGRKFLSPGDRMLAKDDDRGDETVLWSFKESPSKLLGTGWSCGFRTISCVETAPGSCKLTDAEGARYPGAYFWFGQHALAVVWDAGPGELPPLRLPPRPWWERAARARRLRALRRAKAAERKPRAESAESAEEPERAPADEPAD